MDSNDIERVNKVVRDWKDGTMGDLKGQFAQLNIVHRANSPSDRPAEKSLRGLVGLAYGLASKVGFKFPRHMVFVHKGVGRGDTSNRTAKEWFNPVMEKQVDQLADDLAEEHAELAVKAIRIK